MDKRHLKMMHDKDKVVWECLRCGRKYIGGRYDKPTTCPCKKAEYVACGNYIVTK